MDTGTAAGGLTVGCFFHLLCPLSFFKYQKYENIFFTNMTKKFKYQTKYRTVAKPKYTNTTLVYCYKHQNIIENTGSKNNFRMYISIICS